MTEPQKDITRLIQEWQTGDRAAEQELFEVLYRVLHKIALQCLRSERDAGSLGPTALVHEAYLRFAGSYKILVNDRAHFLALAARVMRRIIVDRARARKTEKRGGNNQPVELTDSFAASTGEAEQVLAVDIALERLSQQSRRQAQIVEMRYFGGFSLEETAAVLGVSTRTARRDWQVARLRLKLAIDGARGL